MKIRYYGHNGSGTGYGRAADEMVEALAAAGAELEVRPLGQASMSSSVARLYRRDDQLTTPDTIIVHQLPLDVGRTLAAIPDADIEALTVAYTTWEAFDLPGNVVRSVAEADAIWVPSDQTLRAFARSAPTPGVGVYVVPHAYDDSIGYTCDRTNLGTRPFTFYYVGAWTARKNPGGLIRAFCSAFSRADDVQLLLHCRGAQQEHMIAALAQTGIPQDEQPRIQLSTRELSEPELRALHGALGDVFVTATRGEAWNLPAFEAMLARRHIIIPVRQGSDDYLHDTSATFITGSPAPAMVDVRAMQADQGKMILQVQGAQGLTAKCQWQEPDLCQLARMMREAFERNTRGLDVHYDVAADFGRAAVGRRALALLQEMKRP